MNRTSSPRAPAPFLVMLLVLAIILGFLFFKSFLPHQVVFSNDGPLGVVKSEALKMPGAFFAFWTDLHWIGSGSGVAPVCLTYGLLWLLGPEGFAAFYPPLAVLFLGIGAWTFFRTFRLSPALCVVGFIAAALNSNYFSNTYWGLGSRATTLGCIFFALAALSAVRLGNRWLNAALAGLLTGMAVVEGADIGVILSLFVGAFVLYQSFVENEWKGRAMVMSLRLALVVPFAFFIAIQTFGSLFSLASQGSVGAQMDQETRDQKWTFVSQWSLPPVETLRVIIPGLYGYRMDSPDGGNYWGRVGEAPGAPEQMHRFSGAGEYAGVLVVLIGLWAVAHVLFVRNGNTFSPVERKMIWFWSGAFLISVVLSWGRFDPFAVYKVTFFNLPYFSSIRNPMKFMHAAHMALMILFAYGLLGMSRKYLDGSGVRATPGAAPKSSSFDRWWKVGMIAAVLFSLMAFLIYSSAKPALVRHLMNAGFANEPFAQGIADFSVAEVGKFFLFLTLSVAAVWLIMRGKFDGKRAGWAAVMLGFILAIDLARANLPWILYWDYTQKYASNPILDTLRDRPYLTRVASPSFLLDRRALASTGDYAADFPDVYGIEWVQHHFQYYNIQSVDVAQDPRPPADKRGYMAGFGQDPLRFDPQKYIGTISRYWELTGTRYILGMTGFLEALNTQIDKTRNRFQVRQAFNLAPKPGFQPTMYRPKTDQLTAVPMTNGPLALFEFSGALPRARLFSKWQVSTNGDETMKTLTDPTFDPWSMVLVAAEIPPPNLISTNTSGGSVEYANYSPARIELKANASTPSVLLLNDRYDKDWQVTVDGKPAQLLQCNFIMRGVQVPAGQHTVLFQFRPSLKGLKIGLTAIGVGVVLCALLFVFRQPSTGSEVAAPLQAARPVSANKK